MTDALALRERFQVNTWDAAILSAARAAGCRRVYPEDLNAGQDYDGVRVVNPFADAGDRPPVRTGPGG